jgi:2-oxoisovalerate dehydrogenase E1 component alpha subunit
MNSMGGRNPVNQHEMFQILKPDGTLKESISFDLDLEMALTMYRSMILTRTFDRKSVNLQRQGRMGTYAPFEGQEASQVGSALALDSGDWLFPTYRDHAAMIIHGHDLYRIILYWMGRIEGCVPPDGKHILPPSVPIATQIPHAVGAAWASKMRGEPTAAIAYFGDGATSEGDFHEGMNFAAVFKAPVVLFCQNNGYAISVPITRQMSSRTIAQKGLAYDVESVLVDGNDIFAVYHVTKEALKRARDGEGPTLIEAVTYRYGAHTTADDPKKYRDQEQESKKWRENYDAIDRLRKYLVSQGLLDDAKIGEIHQEADQKIEEAVRIAESFTPAQVEDIFNHALAEKPWNVQEQEQDLLRLIGKSGEKKQTSQQLAEDTTKRAEVSR